MVIIDERLSAAHPFGHSARTRRVRFTRMLTAVLTQHPRGEVWLVRSSDPGRGEWLSEAVGVASSRIRLIEAHVAFASVLKTVDHVYTLTASEGFFAVLANITVHIFGSPYYAGWGLTDDYFPLGGRHARPTREALFHALFVGLPRYLDPFTHELGDLEAVLASLELQRDVASRFSGLHAVAAVGFPKDKRRTTEPFLNAGGGPVRWVTDPWNARMGECAALWSARSGAGLPPYLPHVRLEEGFLSSCARSPELCAPCSEVIDYSGIYFDARRPSDLSSMLNYGFYTQAELSRSKALREQIVAAGLTKDNFGRRVPRWRAPRDAKVVLVPGQPSDDPSLHFGSVGIFTMQALLAQVRKARPDAWLVYRPHQEMPRMRRAALREALYFADVVDTHADIVSLIEAADEIHTISSLAGFDALLRDKTVFTYGVPFYAGWGLTHDYVSPISWRNRRLSIDMLVAGALLRYPLYWDRQIRCFTTPEAIVQRMANCASRPFKPARSRGRRVRFMPWQGNGARLAWYFVSGCFALVLIYLWSLHEQRLG
ncbi:capsular biosynthesis protein [Paraburkholderia humisilvae]|uniref:capsular polysaccharide export protein, LipB/KpsS family n=1 Tax=Paraburkholderia humisilvae TaxID=627669 RepID=UPI001C2E6CDA|nr:capsular biosynthesis protein [Paraburkholderia humisilvae]